MLGATLGVLGVHGMTYTTSRPRRQTDWVTRRRDQEMRAEHHVHTDSLVTNKQGRDERTGRLRNILGTMAGGMVCNVLQSEAETKEHGEVQML